VAGSIAVRLLRTSLGWVASLSRHRSMQSAASYSIWMAPSSGRIQASKTYFAPCTGLFGFDLGEIVLHRVGDGVGPLAPSRRPFASKVGRATDAQASTSCSGFEKGIPSSAGHFRASDFFNLSPTSEGKSRGIAADVDALKN